MEEDRRALAFGRGELDLAQVWREGRGGAARRDLTRELRPVANVARQQVTLGNDRGGAHLQRAPAGDIEDDDRAEAVVLRGPALLVLVHRLLRVDAGVVHVAVVVDHVVLAEQ